MENSTADSVDLIERARIGDREALNSLLNRYRNRLSRMVELRLDTRLQARIDASDVVQEAYVEVAARLGEYGGGSAEEVPPPEAGFARFDRPSTRGVPFVVASA